MAEETGLTPEVVTEIELIYSRMKSQSIPLGEGLIELERELNRQFAQGTSTEDSLRAVTGEIAEITGRLRFVRLQTHLSTPELLSNDQIVQYNQLCGYGPGQGHGEGHGH